MNTTPSQYAGVAIGLLPGILTAHPLLPSVVVNSAGSRKLPKFGSATSIALLRSFWSCLNSDGAVFSGEAPSLAFVSAACERQSSIKPRNSVAMPAADRILFTEIVVLIPRRNDHD